MPFKKFLPLGLTLVAVSGCSHGGPQNGQAYHEYSDDRGVQYRASTVELDRQFNAEKKRFDSDLSQRLTELDARIREIQTHKQREALKTQRNAIQSRMQNIPVASRAEWPALKSELQDRYDVLSASVDKLFFQNQSTGEN